MHRLQSVMNAAARLIYHLRSADDITDAIATLHWLCIPEWITFKIAVMTYKSPPQKCATVPGTPLILVSDQHGRWTLCSADTSQLLVPPVKPSIVGSRAFPVDGTRVWNALPEEITS